MSVSIFDAVSMLSTGKRTQRASPQELTQYLTDYCNSDADREREIEHALRDELYRDGGDQHMRTVIDTVFLDPRTAEKRKKWIPHAKFNNPLKRIVNELSTVYQREARRTIGDEAQSETYRSLLNAVDFDASMLEASRMLTLHRSILIGFRAVMRVDGTKEPTLDVLTPSVFRPVLDPVDSKHVLGWLVRCSIRTTLSARVGMTVDNSPAWILWTDHEVAHLSADFKIIDGTYREHGIVDPETGRGVCPYVAVTVGPPRAGVWHGNEGADLKAARISVWVANVLMLKETKSATTMPVVSGDTSRAARDNAMDSEEFIEMPEGAAFTTVDTSMDLGAFRDVANHVTDSTGSNYGLSPTLMNNQGVQSADARDLMRIPLNELRDQQKIAWRKAERAIAVRMSAVTTKELPAFAFSAAGFSVDFAEGATPLGQADELTMFERKLKLGLDSRTAYLRRLNPDITDEQAMALVTVNLDEATRVQELQREMNRISGADLGGDPALVAKRKAEMAVADAEKLAEDAGMPPEPV